MNMRTESKEKKEYVLFVLDESGSMESIKKSTIDGVNEQIQELRKTSEITTFVSMIKFSSNVTTLYWNKPLEEVEQLSTENYIPNGMTAMLDAVGQGVSRLKNDTPTEIDDVTFLVIIVSDGAENSSKEYTWDSVRKIISECKEDKKWTITYMGANQDLSAIRDNLSIPTGNIMFYQASSTGTSAGFEIMTNGLANYRNLRADRTSSEMASSGVINAFYSSVGGSFTGSSDTNQIV